MSIQKTDGKMPCNLPCRCGWCRDNTNGRCQGLALCEGGEAVTEDSDAESFFGAFAGAATGQPR